MVPTIHIETFSVYDIFHSLMFRIYKTRITFYLWYIAKYHRWHWHVKL